MKLQVVNTTDKRFLGWVFQDDFPVTLPNGGLFLPERTLVLLSGEYRFITSNYIIEAKEM